jgi:hypothetical protein
MLLFLVKFSHSLVIIYMLFCLYWLWEYALYGLHERWIGWIVASILLEAVVFALSGFDCPLSQWAIALGDSSGLDYLSDVFRLNRVDYVGNYAAFAAIGMLLAGKRFLKSSTQRRREAEKQRQNALR